MFIRKQVVFVYDIEAFPNLFTCTCYNTESKKTGTWEISTRKNDLPELLKGFSNKKIKWVGYNNIHYDNPIISYIIMNYNELIRKPIWKITQEIKDFSDLIINSGNEFSSWSKYKYANLFSSFDLLTMMFSQKLRCGLKELQVTMQYPTVQEYSGDFNRQVPENEIDEVIKYNINDVLSTAKLLELKKSDIELRLSVEDEYGINALSKDGVKIGVDLLKKKYLEATGKTWDDIKDLRTIRDKIALKDVILPKIKFETKVLQDLLTEMKTLVVSPGIKGWNKQFEFHNTLISIGVGGQI